MEKMVCCNTAWLMIMVIFLGSSIAADESSVKKVYIVHMNHDLKPESFSSHHDWYASIIQSLDPNDDDSHIYTYTSIAFHGFAAHLYPHQAQFLRDEMDAVIDVHQDRVYSLLTTRTSQFLGIQDTHYLGFHDTPGFAELDQNSHNLVIGVIDSGVWPESKSFDDTGIPAEVPKSWKGECESAPDFDPKKHCNKKLIGARSSLKAIYHTLFGNNSSHNRTQHYVSPRDNFGHGTFTASVAVGSPVANASFFGYAAGTARGIATRTRLATYRVFWNRTAAYSEADVLHGITKAIEDGVNVLSMSLGVPELRQYYDDPVAKASFVAAQLGIIVSCAAGNFGQALLVNIAPWIITVGAGTMDRSFPASVMLGNNKQYFGLSFSSKKSGRLGATKSRVSLVYLLKESNHSIGSHMCLPGSLEPTLVRGKIVVCDIVLSAVRTVHQGLAVKNAGGAGMILANTASEGELPVDESSHVLPAVTVGQKVGDLIREYAMRDPHATAALNFGRTDYNVRPAPMVAWFSSRGPNMITPQILKPDLIAPGYQILAAWPDTVPVTGLEQDTRRSPFFIGSGTSASCPHISGIAALIKVAHPNWSHSAIKSAMMTTTYTMDNTNSRILDNATGEYADPLAYGSGHVDPRKALSPGLVYDTSTEEYTMFLCSLNYTIKQVRAIVQRNITCSSKFTDPGQLNYPSFSVVFQNKVRIVRYTREVTNVGAARSSYNVAVSAPSSVDVRVKPARMVFGSKGERKRYTVTFVAKKNVYGRLSSGNFSTDSGSITWSNARHQVRSPVVFMWT